MDGREIRKLLGTSLKELRRQKGLTQEQLAEIIDKQPSTINRIESGYNFVNSDTLAQLSDALNIHPSILFSYNAKILLDKKDESIKAIVQLLQLFPPNKLIEVYNILNAMTK